MWLGILGSLQVHNAGAALDVRSAKQRVILAALTLHAGQVLSVDDLAEAIWNEAPPAGARATVRNYVKRLRQALSPGACDRIRTRPPGYVIEASPDEIDYLVFARKYHDGYAAARDGAFRPAANVLHGALRLWRGIPLADVPSVVLHQQHVPSLEQMHLQALEWRIEADLALGRHSELVPELYSLVAKNPLRERFHAQLMLALYRCANQGEALAAYRRARQILVSELGVEPNAELRDLHQQILVNEPSLSACASGRPSASAGPSSAGLPALAEPPGDPECPIAVHGGVTPQQLPASIRHFVGRADEMATMTAQLDRADWANGAVPIMVIIGKAGVGKSALAVHWAHRMAARFPDGQLYANLRGYDPVGEPATPAEVISGFLSALNMPAERIPPEFDAQVGLYRSLLAGRRMLIVLDNAHDAAQVRPLLPGSEACLVVVTSRRKLTGLIAAQNAYPVILDVLSQAEAHDLLTRHIEPDRLACDPDMLAELAELCGRLPLALSVAAARSVTMSAKPWADTVAQLRSTRWRLDALETGEPATSMRSVLACSYRSLTDPAARLFALLALQPCPDIAIPAAASLAAVTPEQAAHCLGELTRTHLLMEGSAQRYSLHSLTRAYAAEKAREMNPPTRRRQAMHRILDHYVHSALQANLLWDPPVLDPPALEPPAHGVSLAPPGTPQQAVGWIQAEHANLLAVMEHAAGDGFDRHAWGLSWTLSRFLDRQGHWHELAAAQRTVLGTAQRLGETPARAHLYLGRAHSRLGSHADAHRQYRQALELYQHCADQAGQAFTYLHVAFLRQEQGRLLAALNAARRALRLYQALGHEAGQANAYNGIGCTFAKLGDARQAMISCRLALTMSMRAGDRYCQARAWDGLGHALNQAGRRDHAVRCYERALGQFRILGDRINETEVLVRLGGAFDGLGETYAAHECWQEAEGILDAINSPAAGDVRARLCGLTR